MTTDNNNVGGDDVFSIFMFYYPLDNIKSKNATIFNEFIQQHKTHLGKSEIIYDIGVMKQYDFLSSVDSNSMLKTMYMNKMNINADPSKANNNITIVKPYDEDVLQNVPDSMLNHVHEFLKVILSVYDDIQCISQANIELCKRSDYEITSGNYHFTIKISNMDVSKIEFSIFINNNNDSDDVKYDKNEYKSVEKKCSLLLFNLSSIFHDPQFFDFIQHDDSTSEEEQLLIKWSAFSASICSVLKTTTMRLNHQPNVSLDQICHYNVFFSLSAVLIHEYLFGNT